MFKSLFNGIVDTVDDFIDDPIGTAIDITTQPIRDGIDVVDGLTEGELRTKALARLSVDVVASMSLSELIDWYSSNYE